MLTTNNNTALLLYRVGPVLCAAPCLSIGSIIEPPALTRPPGSDHSHPGIFKYDNNIVNSLDLRYKFGVDKADWADPGRTIITRQAHEHVGFYVDEIIDVISWPNSGWGPLPALLPRGIFSQTLLFKDQIYLYADFTDLLRIQDGGYLRQYIQCLLETEQRETPLPATAHNHASLGRESATTPGNLRSERPVVASGKPTQSQAVVKLRTADASPTATPPPARAHSGQAANPSPVAPRVQHDHKTRTQPETKAAQNKDTTQVTTAKFTHHPHEDTPDTGDTAVPHPHISTASQTVIASNTIRHKHATSTTSAHASKPTPERPGPEATHHAPQTHPLREIFILLALFAMMGLTIWFLFPAHGIDKHEQAAQPAMTPATTSRSQTPPATSPAKAPEDQANTVTQSKNTPPPASQPEQPASDTPPVIPNSPSLENTTSATQTKTASGKPVVARVEYHASIKHDTQGLTITLDAPADDPVFNQVPSTSAPDAESDTVTPATADQPHQDGKLKPAATTKPAGSNTLKHTTPQSVEIIHTVVKGDTLWAIARRYVHNPFRYPELARLSKIKNPDLIYPGDRVRIIKRNHHP